jgi:DHA1 family bicyclomycin/chloramphenicol resistance-like MFS transporter
MLGNLATARLSQRFGVDAMIRWGLIFEVVGTAFTVVVAVLIPDVGPAPIFLPQVLIQIGNGMLLANAIAGAVSVRPQAAGTAAGIVGFAQMAFGAVAAQGITYAQAGATSAIPITVTTLGWAAIAMIAYYALVHRQDRDR